VNTIKFNNTTFEVLNYNRSTTFENGNMSSTAMCNVLAVDASDFNDLAEEPITQIQIYHDNTLIYTLSNISATLYSISEYLDNDKVNINFNLIFDNAE